MKINNALAAKILREEASRTDSDLLNLEWVKKIEKLSRLCEEGVSKTHIAFLGTAILAKTVDQKADLFAIKPKHAQNNPNAFSARSLCHLVLVPLAAELGISLGVTGREPLNNQPYFRMKRLDDGTPVHAGGRAAFDYMLTLVRELQDLPDEAAARTVLHSFIIVRRRYQPRYIDHEGGTSISPDALATAISHFVQANAERGKRAQAVVAGLVDVFAGPDRVESGRINDPSRKYPGDVCIRSESDPDILDKSIEVRDKPVAASDVQIFAKKCVDMGVREAAVVMASNHQKILDTKDLGEWANKFGIGLTLFHGWDDFVEQVLFWSDLPKPVAANRAVSFIHQRLVSVEAMPEAVKLWDKLTSK